MFLILLPFFLGFRRPNLITGLSGWRTIRHKNILFLFFLLRHFRFWNLKFVTLKSFLVLLEMALQNQRQWWMIGTILT